MERIRKSQLESLLKSINKLAGTPERSWVTLFLDGKTGQWVESKDLNEWSEGNEKKLVAQVGHIMLDRAYGGYSIVQIVNENGGERHFGHGYRMTSREAWMCLRSIEDAFRLLTEERDRFLNR